VQLQREELTGALRPLLDEQFFEQVFIDCGAVAWLGRLISRQMLCKIRSPMGAARRTAWLRHSWIFIRSRYICEVGLLRETLCAAACNVTAWRCPTLLHTQAEIWRVQAQTNPA
jgi:hypothetical protein